VDVIGPRLQFALTHSTPKADGKFAIICGMGKAFTFLSPFDCVIFALIVVVLFGPRMPGVFEDFQAAARDFRRSVHLPVMRMEGWELVFLWVIVAVLLVMLMCL
jgi:hypothetical protein